MSEDEPKFHFKIPEYRQALGDHANLILQVGAMAGRLATENRTLVKHIDGRPENVAEHSHMLARIGLVVAPELYPHLNVGLVVSYATVHDDVEAYILDTPTHEFSEELHRDKEALEEKGLRQLLTEYEHIPGYTHLVNTYAEQVVPEARFVRVLDKLMPTIVHFNQGGETLRSHWPPQALSARVASKTSKRAVKLLQQYPEYESLIAVREELLARSLSELYE